MQCPFKGLRPILKVQTFVARKDKIFKSQLDGNVSKEHWISGQNLRDKCVEIYSIV
jgi:3-polyprenyl-4-hydroxybenzoate decarboxylase